MARSSLIKRFGRDVITPRFHDHEGAGTIRAGRVDVLQCEVRLRRAKVINEGVRARDRRTRFAQSVDHRWMDGGAVIMVAVHL